MYDWTQACFRLSDSCWAVTGTRFTHLKRMKKKSYLRQTWLSVYILVQVAITFELICIFEWIVLRCAFSLKPSVIVLFSKFNDHSGFNVLVGNKKTTKCWIFLVRQTSYSGNKKNKPLTRDRGRHPQHSGGNMGHCLLHTNGSSLCFFEYALTVC